MSSLDKLKNTVAQATGERPKKTLRDIIMERQADIAAALPAATGMTPERLTMTAYLACRQNPKLGACTPESLIGALMTAAQLGLEPGVQQHLYFIPRWNNRLKADEASFMLGYKGMIELARRNGVQIKTRTIYENDTFEIEYGFEDRVVHRPALRNRGDVLGYYLTAEWDGGKYVAFMNVDDIERIRQRSLAKDSGPWQTDYDAMARKTLVRAAFNSNQIPQSLALAQAINADETVRTSLDASAIDITREPDATPAEMVPARLGSGAATPVGDEPADGPVRREDPEPAPGAGELAEQDRAGSDRVGGDDEDGQLTLPPDSMPDTIDAALEWLRTLMPKDLRALAKRHASVAPKNTGDVEAMLELAQRVIEAR